MELEHDADRVGKVLRLDSEWDFGVEVQDDGDWAVFSIPVKADAAPEEVFHALAMMAVTIDHHGLVNPDTEVMWNRFLQGES